MSDTASYPARVLKKSLRVFFLVAAIMAAASIGISRLFTEDVVVKMEKNSLESLKTLWQSYQHYFMKDGRVVRPRRTDPGTEIASDDPARVNDNDTVSEGQAYAMLRAAWMNDRQTFDSVYKWTEENLSRLRSNNDHLLAWRYKPDLLGGAGVVDSNSAIDADLDYALALFIAAQVWPDGKSPADTMPYREKAVAVANSIMQKAVVEHPNGELVLMPWPVDDPNAASHDIRINPSYFSPGHYRVFEQETGNSRWGKLAADTYTLMNRLLRSQGDIGDNVATVPDWILMRPSGGFMTDPEKGYVSGYDAFRFWWRVRMDYDISGSPWAREMLKTRLPVFLNKSMLASDGEVASESTREGTPINKWSNPGQTAAYSWSLRDLDPVLSRSLQRQALRRLQRDGQYMYFQDKEDYYINSWAWYAMTEGAMQFPFAGMFGIVPPTVQEAAK